MEVLTIDWGRLTDPTARARVVRTGNGPDTWTYRAFDIHSYPLRTPYHQVIEDLVQLPAPDMWVIDQRGIGDPLLEDMRLADLAPIVGVMATGGSTSSQPDESTHHVSKGLLVLNAKGILGRKRLKITGNPTLAAAVAKELRDYQVKETPHANLAYEGRYGAHDDLVSALINGLWVLQRHDRQVAASITVQGDDLPGSPGYFWPVPR